MSRARQAIQIVLLALAGVAVWAVMRPWLPRAELAESNYQANLIRLQSWAVAGPVSDVIVGSSIAGRLLPSYFDGTPLAGIASLALDGSGPQLGLRLALERDPAPRRVFVEVHRLGKPWQANDEALRRALHEPGFGLVRRLPVFRAETRPTTLLYAWLKGRHEPAAVTPVPLPSSSDPAASDSRWSARFREQVGELRRRGSEVILLRLPVGRENPADPRQLSDEQAFARELGLRLLDLHAETTKRGIPVTYTDGLHLSPMSARRVSGLLGELAGAQPR